MTEAVYADFLNTICTDIEDSFIEGIDERRFVTHDNLRLHTGPLVYQTVEMREHPVCRFEIVRRPPYQPKIGPIEYKIGEVCLRTQQQITQATTSADLAQMVTNIFNTMSMGDGNFYDTFLHCGYTADGIYPPGGYAV